MGRMRRPVDQHQADARDRLIGVAKHIAEVRAIAQTRPQPVAKMRGHRLQYGFVAARFAKHLFAMPADEFEIRFFQRPHFHSMLLPDAWIDDSRGAALSINCWASRCAFGVSAEKP